MTKRKPVVNPRHLKTEYETVGGWTSLAQVTTSPDGLSATGVNLRTSETVTVTWSGGRWLEVKPE